ncbi:sugar MFS transporter [Gallaecimonas kandeliae]|uniref:sugar MFS transporter n=1 Tax=Gallaecimonas kandeliae TaxID=3029055 RepID=UPI002648C5C0|nr:sugar MFS transporter [Gallaecimonas kandeliae]WKE65890.1 sugar MFS transporter [Gallaecimonas kandeliae]
MELAAQQEKGRASALVPMAIIGLLFFIFGFVTWLNGSLIPFLKLICELNDAEALLVAFAFYIAYTVMALPMAALLERLGYRSGMAWGLGIMALGALLFIPAALTAQYGLFLLALFVLGTGLTLLQTASNPYVVLLGPSDSAAMRISIMGIINKTAGVLVPLLFTSLVLADLSHVSQASLSLLPDAERARQLGAIAQRLVLPYLYMAGALLALIALVRFSPLPDIHPRDERGQGGRLAELLRYPQLILGALTLFAYVGLEVIAADTIGLFGERLGVARYASLTSYTMVFMVLGYSLGVLLIPRWLSQGRALLLSGLAGLACVLAALFSNPGSSAVSAWLFGWSGIPTVPDPVLFVAMMGLAHALVWPAVWPLALDGLGRHTAQGSALLIMGIAGGALLPLAFGHLAQYLGNMQLAYALALPCYLMIAFYALKGHKMRSWG